MFVLLSRVYNRFFPEAAKRVARRRQVRYAEYAARRRQTRFVRPHLEDLEERIVPDAYGFVNINTGNPGIGSYMDGTNWTDFTNALGSGKVPTAADTADIPIGADCTLDNEEEQTVGGLTIEGDMTVKSMLTVQTNGNSGSGTTAVSDSGLLDVTTPDLNNTSSTLETSGLTTSGSGSVINFAIDPNATVEVDTSATLSGKTQVTGLFDAKNIDAFRGAVVTLDGPGTVGGAAGQLEAGINATITFDSNSSWAIMPGNPAGSALKEGNFFVDGLLDVDTNLSPDADIQVDPGGTIGGTGDLDIGHKLVMTGGTLDPANDTTIEPSGEFQTSGNGTKTLSTDLTNLSASTDLNGTGGLSILTGATYINAAGTTDVELPTISGGMGGGTFENDANGTLAIKTPISSSTVISCDFVNTGTLNTEGGELTLLSPSGVTDSLDGTLALGDDVTLAGTFSAPSGLIVNAGQGHLKIGDGLSRGGGTNSLDLPEGANVFGYLEVTSNGTLTGAGQLYSNGTVEVDAGATASIGSYQQGSSGTLKLHVADAGLRLQAGGGRQCGVVGHPRYGVRQRLRPQVGRHVHGADGGFDQRTLRHDASRHDSGLYGHQRDAYPELSYLVRSGQCWRARLTPRSPDCGSVLPLSYPQLLNCLLLADNMGAVAGLSF